MSEGAIIGKIIISKILEMHLKKYLFFIEKTINEFQEPFFSSSEADSGKLILARITIKGKTPRFTISDKRLKVVYPIPNIADDKMICSLKWINTRNAFSLHILKGLLDYQKKFWLSGKETDLKPLALKQFLSLYPMPYLDPSRLSRLISNLLVIHPGNQVITLKNLFLSKKNTMPALSGKWLIIMKMPLKTGIFNASWNKKE